MADKRSGVHTGLHNSVLEAIPKAFCATVPVRSAILFALDPYAFDLHAVASHGVDTLTTLDGPLSLRTVPIAGDALRRQRPVTYSERRVRDVSEFSSFRGLTCVPIITQNVGLGVVFCDATRGRTNGARARQRLEPVMSVAATALVALREQQRTAARLADARSLLDLVHSVSSTLDVQEVLMRLAWGVCTLTGARRAAIFAHEPSSATLAGIAGWGVDKRRLIDVREHLRACPLAQLALIEDTPQRASKTRGRVDAAAAAAGIAASDCLPLRAADELLGVVYLELLPAARAARRLDPELLSEFVGLASTALHNARTHRRAHIPTTLAQASAAARGLHDGVAQQLYLIGAAAARVREDDGAGVAARHEGERIAALATQAAADVREALQTLSAGKPQLVGLGPALDALVDATRASTDLEIEVDVAPALRDADDAVAEILYRTCREGLSNVVRHANATSCSVRCDLADGWITAVVTDDGTSFDAADEDGHFGLAFLREALEAVNGTIDVRRREPRGTVLTGRVALAGA